MASNSADEYDTTQSQWEGLTTDNGNVTSLVPVSYWTLYYRDPIAWVALYINDYYLFVLTSIGVPCNMLSFVVLRRLKPVTSAIFVMLILAVVDSLKLCVESTNMVMQLSHIPYTEIGCSFMMTIRGLLLYYPIWLVVFLTLERVVAVCAPLKANAICTLSNSHRSLIFLFILDCIICFGSAFLYEQRYNGRYGCYVKSKYRLFYTSVWLVGDAMLFVMIPLTLLFLGNTAIIIKLRMLGEVYSSSDDTATQERKRQNRSITVMLLAVCITTFICLVPNAVRNFFGLVSLTIIPGENIRTAALKQLTIRMISVSTYTNNAVNFFLYILSGKRFRCVL